MSDMNGPAYDDAPSSPYFYMYPAAQFDADEAWPAGRSVPPLPSMLFAAASLPRLVSK